MFPTRPQRLSHEYVWVPFPADGMFCSDLRPGEHVVRGQTLGEVRGFFGEYLGVVEAPASGYVLWRMTQPILKQGVSACAIAVPAGNEDTVGES